MNYVYDILVNFNENLYDFYDWNLNDPVTHIRRIPIYKVTSKQFYEIKNYQVEFDSKFLETIKNRTEFFSGRNIKIMKYAFLLTDGLDIMGIFIGDSIKYTSLQMDEELDILEDFQFKESHLDYQITSTKNAMILKTRYQIEQINKMRQKLNDLIKENNILFDENVTKGEDLLFNLEYIKHINTNIAVINEPLYYYVSKKTGLNRSFKEPIEDRLKRTENVYKKMKAISEKNNNVIISEIINMYFIHLRNYISENKIKHNINKEFANKLDRPEIREMLDNIKNNEIPNLKFVKKLYYNKKIIFMFLYNKLNLKLSKRSIKREEITK